MNIRHIVYTASVAALATMTVPASAATIIDTGAPTATTSFVLSGIQELAGSFTLTDATTLTGIGGFFRSTSSATVITATITDSTASNLPGNALFSTNFAADNANGYYGGSFAANVLQAGTYFVSFASTGPASLAGSAPNPATFEAFRSTGGDYRGGRIGLSFRLTGDAVAGAVPEPATWAMMIVGFGMAGAAMRRRKRQTVAYA